MFLRIALMAATDMGHVGQMINAHATTELMEIQLGHTLTALEGHVQRELGICICK